MTLYTALLVLISTFIHWTNVKIEPVISCAPQSVQKYFATVSSVKDGPWSDPSTWQGGIIPTAADQPGIRNKVIADISTAIAGMIVNSTGQLIYDPAKTVTIQSTKNVIDSGIIQAKPNNPGIIHTLRFTGINENNFVGTTTANPMSPADSDVGLWVMGSGQLIMKGTEKLSWSNASAGLNAGTSSFNLVKPAQGWLAGDQIAVTPTAENDFTSFEDRDLSAVNGTTVVASSNFSNNHPQVNTKWTTEVMNLTRNVRIEGTATGRSHVFIRSTKPSFLEYVAFRYLGPRKQQSGDAATEAILGRYAVHFHHCMDGSRGSIVRGCVARDIGNNVYVPHVSNGIRMIGNIAYNVLGTAFWWDEGAKEASHNVSWIGNIAAKCDFVRRSVNMFDTDKGITLSARAFLLNYGDDDTCMNNVAVGVTGDPHDGGGYKWEAIDSKTDSIEGVWYVYRNLSHNMQASPMISWQNGTQIHPTRSFDAYHSAEFFHGAYSNYFDFDSLNLFKTKLIVHAASLNSGRVRFMNSTFTDVLVEGSPIGSSYGILFENCKGNNFKNNVTSPNHNTDLVFCEFNTYTVTGTDKVRVQPKQGSAFQVNGTTKTNIPTFAPGIWATGTNGLKATYFTTPNFTNPAFTRYDRTVAFDNWGASVHNKINKKSFSVREEGYFQAQFTEKYTISASGVGTVKMWLNNLPVSNTAQIDLLAGQWYPIKLEYSHTGNQRGDFELKWRSPSLDKFTPGGEFIPGCQLHDKPVVPLSLSPALATFPLPARITIITLMGNPVTDRIRIGVPAGNWLYQLSDVSGRTLGVGRLTGNRINEINVSVLAGGVYILKAVSDKQKPEPLRIIKTN